MCAIYGDGAIAEITACEWFSMFIIGNFDLEDWACSGRSAVIDDDQFKMLITNNPGHMIHRYTPHMSIVRHLCKAL